MSSQIHLVSGYYAGDWKNPIEFTVESVNQQQCRSFIFAFIPGFKVESIKQSVATAETHYPFSQVNGVISASRHLRNRRLYGSAIGAANVSQRRRPHQRHRVSA